MTATPLLQGALRKWLNNNQDNFFNSPEVEKIHKLWSDYFLLDKKFSDFDPSKSGPKRKYFSNFLLDRFCFDPVAVTRNDPVTSRRPLSELHIYEANREGEIPSL